MQLQNARRAALMSAGNMCAAAVHVAALEMSPRLCVSDPHCLETVNLLCPELQVVAAAHSVQHRGSTTSDAGLIAGPRL